MIISKYQVPRYLSVTPITQSQSHSAAACTMAIADYRRDPSSRDCGWRLARVDGGGWRVADSFVRLDSATKSLVHQWEYE